MAYQVAKGYNNTAGLAAMVVEPRSSGILYPRIVMAASGQKFYDGWPYVELRWDFLRKSTYTSLLAQFGLSEATPSVPVTVRLLKNDFTTWANYNALALMPDMGQSVEYERGKFLNIMISLRALQEIV